MTNNDQINNVAAGGADASGSGIAAGCGETGAPPSNTAPLSDKPNPNILILHQGIDSAYLSFPGKLSPEADECLRVLKHRAQALNPAEAASAAISLGQYTFSVRGSGVPRFAYVLLNPSFNIRLSNARSDSLPLATVQISHAQLLAKGFRRSSLDLIEILQELGDMTEHAKVSRLDLCVDFYSDCSILQEPRCAWVGRPKKFAFYEDGSKQTGIAVGPGGEMSARLYDKSLEVALSDKLHMHQVWAENGWLGELPVVRAEFQYRRSVLKELGVDVAGDVERGCNALWQYGTKWLALTVPNPSDSRPSRWPVHPVWEQLRQVQWFKFCDWMDGTVPKRKTVKCEPSVRSCVRGQIACLTSYMAIKGITSVAEARERLYREVLESLGLRSAMRGDDPEGALFDKAMLKATKLGVPFDVAVREGETAGASAASLRYRNRK